MIPVLFFVVHRYGFEFALRAQGVDGMSNLYA
jgi:hypothetical protein